MRVVRLLLYSCLPVFFTFNFFSCNSSHSESVGAIATTDIRGAEAARYKGVYSGSFNKSMLTLVLNYISGSTVSGYDTHKGLRRNVNGQVTRDGNGLNFVLKEPGDNPYDGTFIFSLDTARLTINGKWVPLDSSKQKSHPLALSKKEGEYLLDSLSYGWSAGDSVLTFEHDGSCEFSFYKNPEDSTSQKISVQGSFIIVRDTLKIEWEKNTYFPARVMKLVRTLVKDSSGEFQDLYLKGGGLTLRPMGD